MRVTINGVKEFKKKGEKFAMLTAYDYATSRIVDEAGVPLILVGDSLGMVILGYDSTIPMTMDIMVHHTRAVVKGSKNAMVIGDMPFMSYHLSQEQALGNAARFLQEAGAQAVKLEGGMNVATTVKRIVDCGIPVMGHIGLTPQSVNQLGGFRAQGKTVEAAHKLISDAIALDEAGAFAVVLETVPSKLADIITRKIRIPTIGIGAGPNCDGQVQVINDILGLSDFTPRHARKYADIRETISAAIQHYLSDVTNGIFPTPAETIQMDESVFAQLQS
jgi:3-methyl-2-oxobutanoate hydroxymethyltransferase